jgi:hypothetical protein
VSVLKKFVCGLLVGLILTLGVTTYAVPEIKSAIFASDIRLVVDGKQLDTQIVSVVKSGEVNTTNYVSARALAESLGATVEWDGKAKSINVSTVETEAVSSVSAPAPTSSNVQLPSVIELHGAKIVNGLETRDALKVRGYVLVNSVKKDMMQIVKDDKIVVRDVPTVIGSGNKLHFPYDFYEANILPLLQ